jgi:hypothetical protein
LNKSAFCPGGVDRRVARCHFLGLVIPGDYGFAEGNDEDRVFLARSGMGKPELMLTPRLLEAEAPCVLYPNILI